MARNFGSCSPHTELESVRLGNVGVGAAKADGTLAMGEMALQE